MTHAHVGNGEGRGVEYDGRREQAKRVVEEGLGLAVLEARHKDRQRRQSLAVERRDQGIDRRGRAAFEDGAIEHDRRRRPRPVGPLLQRGERDHALARAIDPGARQHLGRRRRAPLSEQVGHRRKRPIGIGRAAHHEVSPQEPRVAQGDGRIGLERRIPAVFARNHRERRSSGASDRPQSLETVRPVSDTAHRAHHHQPGLRQRLIDIEVDGERVREMHRVGEANRRRIGAPPRCRHGESGELAVGGGQDDDVARRLGEIDRRVAVIDPSDITGEEVHRSDPATLKEIKKPLDIPRFRPSRLASLAPQDEDVGVCHRCRFWVTSLEPTHLSSS